MTAKDTPVRKVMWRRIALVAIACGVLVATISFGQLGSAQAAAAVSVNTPSAYSGGRLMTADPAGGYWTVTGVGAIASYGGAPVFGSPAASGMRLTMPVVGMASTPDGQGYWLVASDGGVLSYGDAQFYGSTGAIHLSQPVVGMASTPDGRGYWLVASDGGIFSFGDAQFNGSLGGSGKSVIGIIISPPTLGYTLVETDGTAVVFPAFTTKVTTTPTTTPTTGTSGPVQPVGQDAGPWNLAFDSEFNGSSLDTSQWSTGWFGSGITTGASSSEQQCYDPSQVSVTNGALNLSAVARTETCGGAVQPYASGMVTTDGKFSFTYGYMEARIWLPGNGSIADWPAFWADGQNWPTNGEIDTLEGLGGQACAHFHNPAGGPGACAAGNYSGGWHTFAADWEPGSLTFYYDGTPVWNDTSGITSAPMYLILNLALSSAITSPNTAPTAMQVDYVRVWQH